MPITRGLPRFNLRLCFIGNDLRFGQSPLVLRTSYLLRPKLLQPPALRTASGLPTFDAGLPSYLASNALRRPLNSTFTPMAHHRQHGGHAHHHHHDNTYLTSTNKKDAGVRITRIGLYVNLMMAISKGLGGYLLNSQALVADSFHSLTDLVSDFLTLATVAWSLKPPTTKFPGGYGKIESLGSLGVSSLYVVSESFSPIFTQSLQSKVRSRDRCVTADFCIKDPCCFVIKKS